MKINSDIFKGLYCITAEKYSLGRDNITVAREMISAGVKIIQYREKEKNKKEKYIQCLRLREITKQNGVFFIVNDDVDIAIAVKADGVHVGQDDMPVEVVRSIVGKEMIIGVSTHSPSQALGAMRDGADYIGAGPLYPTKTKDNVCDAVGLEYLDFAVKNIAIPIVAIGGIKRHNLPDVLRRGAGCAAMVTEITSSPNIAETIKEVCRILESHIRKPLNL